MTSQQIVTFEKTPNGNLLITLIPEMREDLQEIADEEGTGDAGFMEAIEHQLCNGWQEVGRSIALNSALVLTDDCTEDDHGNVLYLGRVYKYMDYQIRSEVEELLRVGQIELTGDDCENELTPETLVKFLGVDVAVDGIMCDLEKVEVEGDRATLHYKNHPEHGDGQRETEWRKLYLQLHVSTD